jgi:DNA-binding CsgD family transcriptional regulator
MVLLLLLPDESVIAVHSICLLAMTILNIHLLIFGAVFVRKNILDSTTSFAGMRIFASAGEGLAIVVFYAFSYKLDFRLFAVALTVMAALLACAILVAMSDTNIDNFHNNRKLPANRPDNSMDKGNGLNRSRVIAMETFESICHEIAKTFELSARETEILILFGRGRDLPYICERLHISKPTTNTHIRHIYEKIGIHSKQELLDLLEQHD